MIHYVMPRHFVADWLRQVTTPSGESVQQLNCLQIRNTSHDVVSWHFPGISLISIDHPASLSAPFHMILVSTPPSTNQFTSPIAKMLSGCEVIAIPAKFARITSGRSIFCNIHTTFELVYLDIQDEFWHAVKTETSICISSF